MGRKPFDEIYEEYYRSVYNYVYMQLLHRQDAEDIVSEVFTKAYSAYDTYQPSLASEKTWLLRIARNALTDHYRRRASHPTADVEDETLEAVPDEDDPFAAVEDDTNRTVSLVLRELRPEEREILLMRYQQDMKNPAIAQELGINEKAVSERIRRALAKSRAILQKVS